MPHAGGVGSGLAAHPRSIEVLHRKRAPFERYDCFTTRPSRQGHNVLDDLIESPDEGKSIIFELGRYNDLPVYMLVANAITRRVRKAYERKTKRYRQAKGEAAKPKPLMITIEEAHKFLMPGIAQETPFGKFAREMRKFFVSLLVVDQRPSAIDDEVLSQIGTKMIAKLNDEKDTGAALMDTSDASSLRSILASLDAKQQALLLGHSVPMPTVVKTRTYGPDFYDALRTGTGVSAAPARPGIGRRRDGGAVWINRLRRFAYAGSVSSGLRAPALRSATCMYTIVVSRLSCPSSRWTVRTSYPFSNRCVANE
jgi:hypothetical protein